MRRLLVLAVAGAASLGCGSSDATSGTAGANGTSGGTQGATSGGATLAPPCPIADMPSTLQLTVSGFATCSCFNGTFTLTKQPASEGEPPVWASAAISGCPRQTEAAYFKLSESWTGGYDDTSGNLVIDGVEFAFGITSEDSDPGSGDSDGTYATSVSCSPLALSGPGAQNGNINGFCDGDEDENMKWAISE